MHTESLMLVPLKRSPYIIALSHARRGKLPISSINCKISASPALKHGFPAVDFEPHEADEDDEIGDVEFGDVDFDDADIVDVSLSLV
uniref:Uncharacterized protein n=1 Tax=Glossina pallidipes TaxID=7398 RepID=A0A1A9ZHU4_GLOPL